MSYSRLKNLSQHVWTKICGVRDPAAARAIAALQPAAIGLNFHPASVRYVTDQEAALIAASIPDSVATIGVFVNPALDDVCARVRDLKLTGVQFHGDESVATLADFQQRCPSTWLVRAFRYGPGRLAPVVDFLEECERQGVTLDACLIDAHSGNAYGGTGTALPWHELRQDLVGQLLPPFILAGGLHPGNVADALSQVRPQGVDVASGVESAPGQKDLSRVADFLQRVRDWRP